MREIVLDTETTGLDPASGDRIVEIGAIELLNYMPTGEVYHQYINPERAMPAGAFAVHGLADEFLADKPVFNQIVDDFLVFIGRSKLVIHNAAFDMKFLNAEMKWCGRSRLPMSQAIDTLEIARKKYPGAKNSLDALCRRFAVDNSGREKHGALLDSELLAEVYLELIGGRQPDFGLGGPTGGLGASEQTRSRWKAGARPNTPPPRLSAAEKERHRAFISDLGAGSIWSKFDQK